MRPDTLATDQSFDGGRFLLSLSRAVYSSPDTTAALDSIAEQACQLASGDAAGVLELTPDGRLKIVGGHHLAADYRKSMHEWPVPVQYGQGPSGLAVARSEPVVSDDFKDDFPEWAAMPWNGIAAFPLAVDSMPLGTLVVYRTNSGHWDEHVVDLLKLAGEYAAMAIRTTQLLAERHREVLALHRMVDGLREQAHEHANRLHALAGLLVLEQPEEALDLLHELTSVDFADRASLDDVERGSTGVLAAMLHVETLVSRHRGVTLEVVIPPTPQPTTLSDVQSVVVIGNLIDNARLAVLEMPPSRRRIRITIACDLTYMKISVRDWGPGLPPGTDWFIRGASSRTGHTGIGLALVLDAVDAAHGELEILQHHDGVTVEVRVPLIGGHS